MQTKIYAAAVRGRTPGSLMLSGMKTLLHRLVETDCDMPDAWKDPFAHPQIRMMTSREQADLPIMPARCR